MRLPAFAAVPPTVLFDVERCMRTPEPVLGTPAVPAAFVPILFACTRVPVAPAASIPTPSPPLPEITLPAPGAVPPITLFVLDVPNTAMP